MRRSRSPERSSVRRAVPVQPGALRSSAFSQRRIRRDVPVQPALPHGVRFLRLVQLREAGEHAPGQYRRTEPADRPMCALSPCASCSLSAGLHRSSWTFVVLPATLPESYRHTRRHPSVALFARPVCLGLAYPAHCLQQERRHQRRRAHALRLHPSGHDGPKAFATDS
ncbi:Uncharacterised protein [Enterobacter kobei]|nr:Uncharacterised protein [Enterobacter kobei]